MSSQSNNEPVRIDKWLWAARFFKTRSLAKTAVENGRVRYDGQRTKPSRAIQIGATLEIQQGTVKKTIVVEAIDDRRKGAPEAQRLYRETEESVTARESAALLRKAASLATPRPEKRPNKKQRREIIQFNQQQNSEDANQDI